MYCVFLKRKQNISANIVRTNFRCAKNMSYTIRTLAACTPHKNEELKLLEKNSRAQD